jgi:hypothetical protein
VVSWNLGTEMDEPSDALAMASSALALSATAAHLDGGLFGRNR